MKAKLIEAYKIKLSEVKTIHEISKQHFCNLYDIKYGIVYKIMDFKYIVPYHNKSSNIKYKT